VCLAPATTLHALGKLIGAAVIVVGSALIGFNPNRWDVVILTLPRGGHGIHLRDVVGMMFIALGIALLWRAPQA
jgi:hypothetical protein